ncbi:hypothetical protein GQ457_04G013320 [Hibiscus cannabinus]
MQSSWLPKGVCAEMEKLVRRFVWGSEQASHGIHLISWDSIQTDMSEGGLGFKDLSKQNSAFLMKIGFQLITDENKLWVHVLKHKYKWRVMLPEALTTGSCSRLWKGLSTVWPLLRNSLCWNIRNGQFAEFWHDNWLNLENSIAHICEFATPPNPAPVASFVTDSGQWDWVRLASLVPQYVLKKIAALPPPNPSLEMDSLSWRWEENQRFSTRSAYRVLCPRVLENAHSFWRLIWALQVPQRIRVFMWLVMREALLTNVERTRRHMAHSGLCRVCNREDEDVLHALRGCSRPRFVWLSMLPSSVSSLFMSLPLKEWVLANITANGSCSRGDPGWPINSPILIDNAPVIAIRNLLSYNWEVEVRHIGRAANGVADSLARMMRGAQLEAKCLPNHLWRLQRHCCMIQPVYPSLSLFCITKKKIADMVP